MLGVGRQQVLFISQETKGPAGPVQTERNMLRQHVGHNMLRSSVHHAELCCTMLAYVASSLKPFKLFAQHMPTLLLFP